MLMKRSPTREMTGPACKGSAGNRSKPVAEQRLITGALRHPFDHGVVRRQRLIDAIADLLDHRHAPGGANPCVFGIDRTDPIGLICIIVTVGGGVLRHRHAERERGKRQPQRARRGLARQQPVESETGNHNRDRNIGAEKAKQTAAVSEKRQRLEQTVPRRLVPVEQKRDRQQERDRGNHQNAKSVGSEAPLPQHIAQHNPAALGFDCDPAEQQRGCKRSGGPSETPTSHSWRSKDHGEFVTSLDASDGGATKSDCTTTRISLSSPGMPGSGYRSRGKFDSSASSAVSLPAQSSSDSRPADPSNSHGCQCPPNTAHGSK